MVLVRILFQRDDHNLISVVDVMKEVMWEADCREFHL